MALTRELLRLWRHFEAAKTADVFNAELQESNGQTQETRREEALSGVVSQPSNTRLPPDILNSLLVLDAEEMSNNLISRRR